MMSVNNRYAALKINVKDPFARKKGRSNVDNSKSTSSKSSGEKVPKKVSTTSPQSSNLPHVEPIVQKSVKEVPSVIEESKPSTVSNVTVSDIIVRKDDRASQNRSNYRKVLVDSNERILERHGGEKSHVKSTEKRHGHGAYNWGDAIDADDSVIDVNQTEAVEEPAEDEVVMQFTLEQYQELLKENKVNPLEWKEQMIRESESERHEIEKGKEFDVRQYQYRPEREQRGRRGTSRPPRSFGEPRRDKRDDKPFEDRRGDGDRPSYRGRGRGRGGPRDNNHHYNRGTNFNAPRANHKVPDVRIDDRSDFPDINLFN